MGPRLRGDDGAEQAAMANLPSSTKFLTVGEHQLEYCFIEPPPNEAPTLVLLHEGLGSVGLWGPFPEQLAQATGCGVFAYSRAGYGHSSPVPLPRPFSYMHDEARDILPRVLDQIGFRRGLLVGQSDGASIAALYTGSVQDHRVRGLVLIAPHFIVEDCTAAAARAALTAYTKGDLRERLARWHAHVDVAFHGWNQAWIDPAFQRQWNTLPELAHIRVPLLIVQGENDQYGTARQIEIAQEECYCPVEVALMPGIGHAPHREAPEQTVRTIADFIARLLHDHGEGVLQSAHA
jgi:pimeloyl-ACP methyl ester carboxylesterase